MRVTVIDYKAGNLTSVLKTLRHLGAEPVVVDSDPSLVDLAERLILPGVGHFAATQRLVDAGLVPAIRAAILRGTPFLGICVGMQWLYAGSTEAPNQPGSRAVLRVVRALPRQRGEGSSRWMEFPGSEEHFAIAGGCRTRRVCIFHAFLQSAGHCGYRCDYGIH